MGIRDKSFRQHKSGPRENKKCGPCVSHARKGKDMSVKVHLHTTHLQFTNGLKVVSLEGSTVGECLNHLVEQFPGMGKALFAKKDQLLKTVEIYLNHASAYPNELLRPVKDGDEIHLIVMLAGG